MKFLVDAQLPPSLCEFLRQAGHEAIHTRQLGDQNQTTDGTINELSIAEEMVVISKDTDFFYSHLLQQRPFKLLLVRTGNIGVKELKEVFQRHLPQIIQALEQSTLVELDRHSVQRII